jgi:hypothetical protein
MPLGYLGTVLCFVAQWGGDIRVFVLINVHVGIVFTIGIVPVYGDRPNDSCLQNFVSEHITRRHFLAVPDV